MPSDRPVGGDDSSMPRPSDIHIPPNCRGVLDARVREHDTARTDSPRPEVGVLSMSFGRRTAYFAMPLYYSAPALRGFCAIGPNQQRRRNFPGFADGVDHRDGQRAAAGENFRSARARSENPRQLGAVMAEFVDRKL